MFDADEIRACVTAMEARVKRIQSFGSVTLSCWPHAWNASAGSLGNCCKPDPIEALDGLEIIITKREEEATRRKAHEGALARTLGIAA